MQAAQSETHLPHIRLANVDALRALCAFAVLFFHFGFRGSFDGHYAPLFSPALSEALMFGQSGVLIFFSISGFVIAYSSDKRSALQFAISRFSRIYPTFLLCLTLVFAAQWFWGGRLFSTSWIQYFANFGLLPQVFGQTFQSGVYWSIVVEVIFYAWVFLLVAVGVFQKHRLAVVVTWLLLAALNEWWLDIQVLRQIFLTDYASFFAFGILLHMRLMSGRLAWHAVAALWLAIALCFNEAIHDVRELESFADFGASEIVSMFVVSFGLLALVVAVYAKPVAPAALLAWCGGISYPLYLLHEGLGQIAIVQFRNMIDGPILFGLTAIACTVVASLVWWLFDRHAVPRTRKGLERVAVYLQTSLQPMRFVHCNNIVQRTKL